MADEPTPDPKPGDDPKPDPKPEAKPPWGSDDDFKPDKAWQTIQKQRESEAAAKERTRELEAKLKEFEDRDKTDQQKAADKANDAEKRATTAEGKALRLEVALDKAPEGMTLAQVRKLAKRLSGSTKEELETDADELFADFAPTGDEDDVAKGGSNGRRPQERLRPGAAPSSEPEENDPRKLAEKVGDIY